MKNHSLLFAALLTTIVLACNQQSAPSGGGSNAPLEKTNWKLSQLPALPGALPEAAKAVTLLLDSSRAAGNAGCNRFFGSYTLNGSKLQFTGIGSTKMFCEGKMEIENSVMNALNNTNTWHIAGKTLSLIKDSDTLARFEAGAAQ